MPPEKQHCTFYFSENCPGRDHAALGFSGGAGRAGRGDNGVQREGIASRIELEAALHLPLLRKLAGAAIMRLSGFL